MEVAVIFPRAGKCKLHCIHPSFSSVLLYYETVNIESHPNYTLDVLQTLPTEKTTS
jgi:hypothetical protein